MSDEPKKPTYRPSRGFITDRESGRVTKKSAFLKRIERAQHATEFDETDLRIIGEGDTPPPKPLNVVLLDQSRRKRR